MIRTASSIARRFRGLAPAQVGRPAAGLVFLWLFFPLVGVAQARSVQEKPHLDPQSDDPEVERQLLQIPEGFEIQLFASDPVVKRPVSMSFDARGRLWVLCIPRYPQILPGQDPDGYVVVLEDRAGKGRADTSTVFLSGLGVATGMVPGDGGLYLGEGESLSHYRDTDGKGTADERRVLLTGFGTQDTHHTLNTFQWGPDGGLYFNQGLFLTSNVETPRGIRRLAGGGVWQLKIDSLDLEIIDRTLRGNNTWGHIWDRWGRSIFASAWVSDINVGLEDSPLNDQTGPEYIPPIKLTSIGGERHSGLDIVSGRHFPQEWQDNLITGGFHAQKVHRALLKDDGEHLSTQPLPPLVISHHQKFRPIDIKMGPDGAIYVCDWYNLIIQHNQVNFRDPRRDHDHGRIWRITKKDRPLVPRVDLTLLGFKELLGHLRDPEQWTRNQTRRVLAERPRKEVAEALGTWVASIDPADPAGEPALLEALWVYQTIGQVEPGLLHRLLRAKEPRVRAAATAVLGAWQGRLENPVRWVGIQAADPNLRVRLEAVIAAERIPQAGSLEAALHALRFPIDPLLDFELKKATLVLKSYWYPGFLSGSVTFGNDPRALSFALASAKIADAAPKLLDLYASGKIAPECRADLLASVAALGNPDQLGTVLGLVSGDALGSPAERAKVLDALARSARDRKVVPAGDLGCLGPLLRREDTLGLSALRAAGAWKLEAFRADLAEASGEPAGSARRQAAVASLVDLGGPASVSHLASLSGPGHPYRVRVDAVAGLASLDLERAASLAAKLFGEAPPPGVDPAPAIGAFLHREGGEGALAGAMALDKPAPEVALVGLREINANGWPFPRLTDAFRAASPVVHRKRELSPEIQRHLVEMARTQGDPARGERHFRSAALGCLRCHAIAGAGGALGPDLASIGATAQPDFLVEHLLLPTKSVKEGFAAYEVLTKEGDALSGIRVRENAQEIVLRDTNSEEIVIRKSQIKRQRDIRTLMPVGLADILSDEELADLVRFLMELGKPGPFSVGTAPVLRQWRTLVVLPEFLSGLADEPRGRALESDARLVWARSTSNVAGELPLTEVAIGPKSGTAVVRAGLQVTAPGKIAVSLGSPEGLRLWIDGKGVPVRERLELDLGPGYHTLDGWVDLASRKSATLRWELPEPPPGGSGRALWAPNR
jgi:putative heme-binding domain-containing protein